MNRTRASLQGSPRRPRFGAPLAVACALSLLLASNEASAAALRGSALALGALGIFAAVLFAREWPIGLTGSIWVAGSLFAAAFWLLRARWRPAALVPSNGAPTLDVRGCSRPDRLVVPTPAVSSAGIDPQEVLLSARHCFIRLQAAWDAGDLEALRLHTTEDMLAELTEELSMRGAGPNRTDVVTLEASLLALEELGPRWLASVEFSGMIRESPEQGATAFKEVWMLTCRTDAPPAWRLARHQALL